MKKRRDPKFELLRISSMFMIIIWHILMYASVMDYASPNVRYVLYLLQAICVVHVNSYILVTGYYQCKTKFNPKKVFGIMNASWFYRVLCTLIVIGFQLYAMSTVDIIRSIMPYQSSAYWFINSYLVLYLLSPFLNILLKHLNQKQHKMLIVLLVFLTSVMTNLSNQRFFYNNYGLSPVTFVMLYIIGAYFRNYPLSENKLLKGNTRRKNQLLFFSFFVFAFLVNYLMKMFTVTVLTSDQSVIAYLSQVLNAMFTNYDNPLVLLGTIMYFGYFSTLEIKHAFLTRLINRVSALTLGIYMIHENLLFRFQGYQWLGFIKGNVYYSWTIVIRILLITVIIFVICAVIEWLRQWLFNMIKRTKWSKRFRNSLLSYWNSLGIYPIELVK